MWPGLLLTTVFSLGLNNTALCSVHDAQLHTDLHLTYLHCTTLHYTAVYCSALCIAFLHCTTALHCAVHCLITVQCSEAL